ncbi:5537_t:CDS:2, partial [Funneliformis mosseae]
RRKVSEYEIKKDHILSDLSDIDEKLRAAKADLTKFISKFADNNKTKVSGGDPISKNSDKNGSSDSASEISFGDISNFGGDHGGDSNCEESSSDKSSRMAPTKTREVNLRKKEKVDYNLGPAPRKCRGKKNVRVHIPSTPSSPPHIPSTSSSPPHILSPAPTICLNCQLHCPERGTYALFSLYIASVLRYRLRVCRLPRILRVFAGLF